MATSSVNSANNPTAMGFDQAETGGKKSLGQQDFLRLMVAQVQNQDPLQPQANGEFLSQLAQFSTSDGIGKMQNSLEQLAGSLQSNQALQASALVGRKVMVNTNNLKLGGEGDVQLGIDVIPGVNKLTASVYSSTGELIKTFSLGQPAPGHHQFSWDGTGENGQRVVPGDYQIKVQGERDGKVGALATTISSNVDSVSVGQYGGVVLNVAGIGNVSLDQVVEIAK